MRFFSTVFALALLGILAAVGGARADAHRDQLEHRAEEARSQAAESAAISDGLAAQIAADSARIDSLEGVIGHAQAEVAGLGHELAQSRAKLKETERAPAKNAAGRALAREHQDHTLVEDVQGIRARLTATQKRLAQLRTSTPVDPAAFL